MIRTTTLKNKFRPSNNLVIDANGIKITTNKYKNIETKSIKTFYTYKKITLHECYIPEVKLTYNNTVQHSTCQITWSWNFKIIERILTPQL